MRTLGGLPHHVGSSACQPLQMRRDQCTDWLLLYIWDSTQSIAEIEIEAGHFVCSHPIVLQHSKSFHFKGQGHDRTILDGNRSSQLVVLEAAGGGWGSEQAYILLPP